MGSFEGFKLSEERPEIKAWTDLINLKNIPVNKIEMSRLKQFEVLGNEKEEAHKQKTQLKMGGSEPSSNKNKKKEGNSGSQNLERQDPDESRVNLLNAQTGRGGSGWKMMEGMGTIGGNHEVMGSAFKGLQNKHSTRGNIVSEANDLLDADREFLELTELYDMDRTYLESAMEKFDETSFDAFA